MKNQTYRMTMLYDFYGDLLTARQKEFYDLYYNEDLSLTEIAENYGITRQGVRDIIVRAEAALEDIEDKTGLIQRYHHIQTITNALQKTIQEIRTLNEKMMQSFKLLELCDQLENSVLMLRKE